MGYQISLPMGLHASALDTHCSASKLGSLKAYTKAEMLGNAEATD